jgi:hypothetical protein
MWNFRFGSKADIGRDIINAAAQDMPAAQPLRQHLEIL